MTLAIGFLSLWLVLGIYSVLTAMDFGAGVLYSYGYWTRHEELVQVVDAYASPVWEAINALLILFIVGIEALFPNSINVYAELLLLPAGISFLLLSVRQIAFALRHESVGQRLNPLLFGILGPLVPLPAMAFFAILQGQGFSTHAGHLVYGPLSLLFNPISLAFMGEAFVSEFYLGALLVTWYAALMQARDAYDMSRKIALLAGILVLAVSPTVLALVGGIVPSARASLLAELPWFIGAVMLLLVSLIVLVVQGSSFLALLSGVLMYLLGFAGYGVSQMPWLIRGYVRMDQAVTNSSMLSIISWVLILGLLVIVIPSALLVTAYLMSQARMRYQSGLASRMNGD